MKKLCLVLIVIVLCMSVLSVVADNSQKINQLTQEQKERIEYINKLSAEIQVQRDAVLKLQGAIEVLTELDAVKVDTTIEQQ